MNAHPPASAHDQPDEELLPAFVGPQWERHYRARFDALRDARGPRQYLSWNWAAALVPFWHAYRRLGKLQAAWTLLLAGVTMVIIRACDVDMRIPLFLPVGPLLISWIVVGVAQGLLGDRGVYHEALRATHGQPNTPAAREEALALVRRRGGVSWRGPVLCAALLALAVTRPQATSLLMPALMPRLYRSHVRNELRNLMLVQDSVFAARGAYARDLARIFESSPPITVEMREVTAGGWSATGRYQGYRGECGVYVGDARPPVRGARPFEPRCDIQGPHRLLDWLWRRR